MESLQTIIHILALVGAVLGIALDLWSLVAWLRRNIRGSGPSGVSGVAWVLYFAFAVSRHSALVLAVLTLFHVACQWIIPVLHRRLLARECSGE